MRFFKNRTVQMIAASVTMFLPMTAQAAISFDELQLVTKLAYADFVRDNPTHAAHFLGFKTWISADDGKVKIYVNHNGTNMEFNYTCHNHDGEYECHGH